MGGEGREFVSSGAGALPGIALFALGSFAVGEPRIGSDADLVIVIDSGMEGPPGERAAQSAYMLSRVFSDGGLLKIDFRLRGEGANAPLVQDIEYYARYFRTRSAPWERVAFAKCAYWWGDAKVAEAFLHEVRKALAAPLREDALDALVETRRRLEGLVPENARRFETKRSAGGRYDIEYLASIGLARTGAAFALHASTPERVELLRTGGILSSEEASTLAEAWEFFHRVDFLLELQNFSLPNTREKIERTARYLDRTFECLGMPIEGGVAARAAALKREVRECYSRVIAL